VLATVIVSTEFAPEVIAVGANAFVSDTGASMVSVADAAFKLLTPCALVSEFAGIVLV
jgi:uncharacterized protein YcbX